MTGTIWGLEATRGWQFRAVVLLAILLALPIAMLGQSYFGTVSGIVMDSSESVVSGARVTLKDQAKGYVFNTTSEATGRYIFNSVPPGLYTVTAEFQGFEKALRTNVKVNVTENATANFTLKVASTTEAVDVVSQADTLATEDAVTGQVVNRRFINDLPLVNRYVMDLTYLAPGITNMDDQCPNCGGTNFVSNGSRGANADILMDGASITNFEPNGGITQATYTPSPEAVEEFKVQQSNFSAEYGFSGSTVINMVTRSGTNQFHGSGYDFLRNQMTDANNWFNNRYGNPIPPVHRNNYGGTFGGPIIKNRTFFFFDWDGSRSSNMRSYAAGVPSLAERNGDFGEICTAAGGEFDPAGMCTAAAGQIWDPYSGTYDPDAGGVVRSTYIPFNNIANYQSPGSPKLDGTAYQLANRPGNLIDPVAQKMMKLFPEANQPNGSIYNNWSKSGAGRNYNDQFDVKVDHRFNDQNLVSVKFSHQWNHYNSNNCFGNFTDPCSSGKNGGGAYLATINDTHTFTPTLLLTSTLGLTRSAMAIDAYNTSLDPNPLATLGFPSYLETNGVKGVPAVFMGGGYYSADTTAIGGNPWGNYRQGQTVGQWSEALSKIQGSHSLKFGFEGRLRQQNYLQTEAPLGTFSFGDRETAACPTGVEECGGDAMASFLMGMVSDGAYEIQFAPATQNYQFAWFAQDNWKVTPKLTLNLGLRHDVSLPRTERHNRMQWFDTAVASPLSVPELGALHGGEVYASPSQRQDWLTDWRDIQPRFGFAYKLTPKTVVRGGYGIYYDQSRSGANGLLSYDSRGFKQTTGMITTYQNDRETPYLHLSNPYPNGLILPVGSTRGLMSDVGFDGGGPLRTPQAARTPYEQSWSFGFEHQLPSNLTVGVQYLGKKGTHLYFAGTNQLNVLGPQIEKYSQSQIADLNNMVPNPFYNIITDPNSGLSGPEITAAQLMVPFPQFTSVTTDVQAVGNSMYHALQLTVEKRYSNGLQLSANYTWSKSIDDSSTYDDNVTWMGSFLSLQNPNNRRLERSVSTFDMPSVLKLNYSYDFPIGRGRAFFNKMPRALDMVVGGWKTNGIWTMASGRPLSFSVMDGGTPLPTYGGQRPNVTGTPKRNTGSDWIDGYFANPDVFQIPDIYTLGNAPRAMSSVRGPFFFSANLSMAKDFQLSQKRDNLKLELRLEAQNAFNHPVFSDPNTTVGDPSFGIISGTSVGPRTVQLALKVSF